MTDLWGFLLQTLTASGVAALLLVVKAMFRDKLSPRWQFAAWSVLGLALLVPAGTGGRYVLVNWPWLVETVKTALTGDCSLTRVLAPVPLPRLSVPETAAEWLYAVYAAGVLIFLVRCAVFYIRLRLALRRGAPAGEKDRLAAVAERYGLPTCPAVEVPGLTSAFICGVFRPVLALPAGRPVDDKILLHELLHLKYRDVVWGLAICLFRCIHWCNPLLWMCANQAGNDLEALCDQRVLERLEGEERRDYGRILLSMTDERYARAPGTSSMANGGQNIRRRVEAIARFKRYPAGMALVSVCVAVTLAASLLGIRAKGVYEGGYILPPGLDIAAAMASARTVRCTTPAGALDAYAKAVLDQNPIYRAMCTPLEEQAALAEGLYDRWPNTPWESGLPAWPNTQSGYVIYNLESTGKDAYEGLLVVQLNYPPEGQAADGGTWLGVQAVRAERQEDRWVVLPLEDFWATQSEWTFLSTFGCEALPAYRYEAQAGDFLLRLGYQTTYTVDSYIQSGSGFFSSSSFNTTPQPNAEFSAQDGEMCYAIYMGETEGKEEIYSIGASCAPLQEGEARPDLRAPGTGSSGGSSSNGSSWGARLLEEDWGPEIWLFGGGSSGTPERFIRPEAFAADFYINGQKTAELTLLPVEGGAVP